MHHCANSAALSPNNKFLRPELAESPAFGMNHFQPLRLPSHRRPQRSAGGAQRLDGVGAEAIRRTSYPHKTRKTPEMLERSRSGVARRDPEIAPNRSYRKTSSPLGS